MDTLRLLRAQLEELVEAQPRVVRDFAQLIFQIPDITESQVYGFMLRNPQAFLAFLQAQVALPAGGHASDITLEHSSNSSLIAQVNELRTFIYIHLRRTGLHQDARYSFVAGNIERFVLPGESQNLLFADALLTAGNLLLLPEHALPNRSHSLVAFARAFLSAAGRSQPGLSQIARGGGLASLGIAWFVISLYTGSPGMRDYSAVISADDASAVHMFGSVIHTLAALTAGHALGDIGDVAKQFRRSPGVAFTPSTVLPQGLEVFSLALYQELTFGQQEIAKLVGMRIKSSDDQDLWYRICRFEDAFFAYCRQIQAGRFDASAFQSLDSVNLTDQLMRFILQDPDLQRSIEGIRFLHNSPHNQPEMQPADVRTWNSQLFARWQQQSGHDDHEDIDILTERMLSHELLEMAASTTSIDVRVLAAQQLSAEPAAAAAAESPFPGFEAPETPETAAGQDANFDDVCLFCVARLCDVGQPGGEPVYILPCCRAKVGSVCLEAYRKGSSVCPFCSQAL